MYLGYQNGQVKFYTVTPLDLTIYKLDGIKETQDEYVLDGDSYVLKDSSWEEKQAQKEAERISQLNMTRGDFFEGLILSVGKDEDDVLALIDVIDLTETERKIYKSRVKNALDFYRGYPLIDVMCGYLGINPDNMTLFFETKDYTHLIPIPEEPTVPETEEPDGEILDNEVGDTTTTDTTTV